MSPQSRRWRFLPELRPDELEQVVREAPVAYWPLGLIEHHGYHLPVGFDGLKADRILKEVAGKTGGVLLPVLWWGCGGGHGDFKWTFYQEQPACESIVARTVERLLAFGFRAIVLLCGHYPWRGVLQRILPDVQSRYPEALLLWGTEMTLGGQELRLPGDHAARWETSYGLATLPELVDLDALRPGRDESVWPGGRRPDLGELPGNMDADPASPTFAQCGQDARTAGAEEGRGNVDLLVAAVAEKVLAHLAG